MQPKYEDLVKKFGDFSLGADPEFKFEGIKARSVVPFEGKFGADGPNSQICELRPAPQNTPEGIVNEFSAILRSGWRTYPEVRNVKWLAGSYPEGCPVGGHIHFGIKLQNGNEFILEALDKILSPIVMMLEETEDAKNRRRSDYGKLSVEYRGFDKKDYGFEYRSPASWLVSKQLTRSVFSLAKTIGYEFMNKKQRNRFYVLLKMIELNTAFKNAHSGCDKSYFKPLVPIMERILRTTLMYPIFANDINYMFQMIYMNKTWGADKDIKSRWGIGNVTCLTTTREGKIKPFMFKIADLADPTYRWVPNDANNFVNRFLIPRGGDQ